MIIDGDGREEMTVDKDCSLSTTSLLLDQNQTSLSPAIDADTMTLFCVNDDDEGAGERRDAIVHFDVGDDDCYYQFMLQ